MKRSVPVSGEHGLVVEPLENWTVPCSVASRQAAGEL